MKITYARDADVLTIQLSDGQPADSADVAEGVIVHLSENGRPLEIEILSNGSWCVKFRVLTTAGEQHDLGVVVADLNEWLAGA